MGMIKLLAELLRLRRNTTLGRQELSEVQEQKMRHILRYAWDHSAFYRRTFAEAGITEKTIDTAPIQSFPTIDKETLMEHFEELVTVEDLKQEEIARFDVEKELSEKRYLGKYHLVHSSGSTGVPRYFVYDEAAWHQMLLGIIRGALWGMSMPEILRLLTPKPRIMYIAATDGRYGGAMAVGDGIDGLGAHQMQLNVNTPLEDWKKAAEEFNPNIIIGYPSAVKILGGLQKEGAIHLKLSRLITCGEPLSAGLRKFLESVFSVKVVNFYGSSESLAMGVETDAEEGMYLFDDLNYIEYTNGQMYLTCLYNEVQPLIRYRLTDKLRFREDSRQHGMKGNRAFSRVETVTGRDEDILWFQDRDGRQ
ncbi:MAG: AMP-binding protein, partial [Clostridiales bacterium]|nr:AMP-binding protein [Clostridiales bacterium]